MSIGKRIKERRLEMNLSQRDLAAKLGYSDHTTLTRIEADKIDLPQSRIKQLSSILNVSVGYLMGWEEEPEEAGVLAAKVLGDIQVRRLVENYLSLSQEDKNIVSAVVVSLAAKRKDQPEGRS